MQNETALSRFRSLNGYPSGAEGIFPSLLRQALDDKDIDLRAIRLMIKQGLNMGQFIKTLLLRSAGNLQQSDYGLIVKMALQPNRPTAVESYNGAAEQNVTIDRSLMIYNRPESFIGEAAMAKLDPPANMLAFPSISHEVRNIPIAIIGRGPAGVMAKASLIRIGFTDVTMFDKRGSNLGIWAQPNVAGGTKNNPRLLEFEGLAKLDVAKGDGSKDGATVAAFVRRLAESHDEYSGDNKSAVRKVEASDFKHIVHFENDGQSEFREFPIVINCMGTGKPRPLSNDRMVYSGKAPGAVRWQQQLDLSDVEGKSIAIVGLGNSTAEMMTQLNKLREEGADCDYRIFTHMPEDAIQNPNDRVYERSKYYRVFRDLSRPDLTGFQGDLPRSRADYFQALDEGRIICGVKSWRLRGKYLNATARGNNDHEYSFDKLYVLTGYEQDRELLSENFSITFDGVNPVADYDGEFRDDAGDIIKGYFGLGALMDSQHDPNAVVIPGMMFRMPDMLFTVVCRAFEYHAKAQGSITTPVRSDGPDDDEDVQF